MKNSVIQLKETWKKELSRKFLVEKNFLDFQKYMAMIFYCFKASSNMFFLELYTTFPSYTLFH